MSTVAVDSHDGWLELLSAARQGDDRALGEICQRLRTYLLLAAANELGRDLSAKMGASDIVQDAMLDVCHDFRSFKGTSEEEFRGWVRRLIQHNLIDSARRFRRAQCRDVARETSLTGTERLCTPATNDRSSSSLFRAKETDEQLLRAIARLPQRRQHLLELRHRRGLTFAEAAAQMQISEVAARKLWSRTIQQLQRELSVGHGATPSQTR